MESKVLKKNTKSSKKNQMKKPIDRSPVLRIEKLGVSFDQTSALENVNLNIYEKEIMAIMGPSGCGKSSLIRSVNRMHSLVNNAKVTGNIFYKNEDILKIDPIEIRQKIGMVFQRPNPFPTMSIYQNTISGYLLTGKKLSKSQRDDIVEESLTKAALWQEVKDRLHDKGTALSGGQQQRLCIARALAMRVEMLLLDEPTSALDPISTASIESLLLKLKKHVTIMMVTHNISQAKRLSDTVAFMLNGNLIECDKTEKVFKNAKDKRTKSYLVGEF